MHEGIAWFNTAKMLADAMKDFTHLTINDIVFIREDNWGDAWKRSTLDGVGADKVNPDQQNEEQRQETEVHRKKCKARDR